MDRTVPAGAARLLAFIGDIEAPGGYGVIFANRQDRLDKPLTTMTVDEVLEGQKRWARWGKPASSAAGRYQFMRATLTGLKKELGLRGTQKFDANLQDRLGYHLLRRRGYDEFMAGDIDLVEFGKRLAMEWASLPVLKATKGAHRQVKAGDSFYAGDGVNKDLTSPSAVAAVLKQVFEAGNTLPPREEKPPIFKPIPAEPLPPADWNGSGPGVPTKPLVRPGLLPLIVLGLVAAGVAAWVWWTGQQPAEPASALGGMLAPVPLDRPVSLFGGPGSSLAGEIAMAILMSFIQPLVAAAATYAVGWVVYMWGKVLKTDFDKKSADSLHAALERGILAAIEHFGARTSKATLLASAANYAEQWNGGTVKRFGLTHDDLQELAVPHLAAAKRGSR